LFFKFHPVQSHSEGVQSYSEPVQLHSEDVQSKKGDRPENFKTEAGNGIYRIIQAAFSNLTARIMPKIPSHRVQTGFG